MANAKQKSAAKGKKSSGKLVAFVVFFGLGLATMFMLPTLILVLLGFIPTYVAFGTDTDQQKSGAVSVGAMNFAGLVPFIIDLIQRGQSMPNVFHILANPDSWLIILGASAIGQMIVYAIPQAIATLTLSQAEQRAKILRTNLDTLKEHWGPDVATTKSIDQINQE